MRVGSLFSGCAGLDLGLERAGHEIVWACENDRYCRRILATHWPDLHVYGDIQEVRFEEVPDVDMLAGGFPCQDLSYAGKGSGLDGQRSGLWFEYARAICALRPRYVLVENVPGLATKMGARPGESALGTVIADLAEAGYLGSWLRLRASDVGAPHLRERIFIIASLADPSSTGRWQIGGSASTDESQSRGRGAYTDHQLVSVGTSGISTTDATIAADTECIRGRAEHKPDKRLPLFGTSGQLVTNPSSEGCQGQSDRPASGWTGLDDSYWGKYAPAIRRWESLTRPAPRATDDLGRLDPRFVEWMLGYPDEWSVGVSRTQRLKMLGNSVQVQVAELLGSLIGSRSDV